MRREVESLPGRSWRPGLYAGPSIAGMVKPCTESLSASSREHAGRPTRLWTWWGVVGHVPNALRARDTALRERYCSIKGTAACVPPADRERLHRFRARAPGGAEKMHKSRLKRNKKQSNKTPPPPTPPSHLDPPPPPPPPPKSSQHYFSA